MGGKGVISVGKTSIKSDITLFCIVTVMVVMVLRACKDRGKDKQIIILIFFIR